MTYPGFQPLRANFQGNKIFMIAGFCFQHFMTINAAPGRNILHDAGIGADNLQLVASLELFDFVLGTYDGQRTE